MENKKVLKIIIGEETQPVVESHERRANSLFSELYDKAFDCINTFLGAQQSKKEQSANELENDIVNNVIAFIGDRGSGKTSCMLSVANMLVKSKEKSEFEKLKHIRNTKFVSVNNIEPSFFDERTNILELVTATLFKQFRGEVYSSNNFDEENRTSAKHQLLANFQEVYTDIKNIKNNEKLDSLDDLIQLSSSIELRSHFKKLIENYLNFVGHNGDSNCEKVLLLTVDDIDLNTRCAYQMLEQIRKYLLMPNVLILLSVKMEQMEQVLINEYCNEFSSLLSKSEVADQGRLRTDISIMAERYLQKLIPLKHRINMPDMEVMMDRPLFIYESLEEAQKDSPDPKDKDMARNKILALIFEKTRFLFYNTKGVTSYIIPRNLREFRNLIALLYTMPQYTEDFYGHSYNKTLFQKYFYQTWCENNLTSKYRNFFQEIVAVKDTVNINATVVSQICILFESIITSEAAKKNSELLAIINKNNQKWNISIGDVNGLLNFIERHIATVEAAKFLFALKSHYSMILYEYYNELTCEGLPISMIDNSNNNSDKVSDTEEVIRKDILYPYSNYAILVGGSYVNSNLIDIVPPQVTNKPRHQRLINGKRLRQLIDEIYNNVVLNHNSDPVVKQKFGIVEFVALHISRNYDSKNDNYREKNDIWYTTDLGSVKRNFWFDITASLFNCLNISDSYKRIDPRIYEISQQIDSNSEPKTILEQFDDKFRSERNYLQNQKHQSYSVCAFRNMEVLDGLITHLQSNKPKGNNNNVEVFMQYFNYLSNYRISSYYINDNKYADISFNVFSIFADFLNTIKSNESLSKCFDEIYSIRNNKEFVWKIDKKVVRAKTHIDNLLKQNQDFENKDLLESLLNKYFNQLKYTKEEAERVCEQIKKELDSDEIDG